MNRRTILPMAVAALALALSIAIPAVSSPSPRPLSEAKMRVGTFRRTEILVAWHRSAVQDARIRDLIRRRDEAKAKGDTQLAQALEERGAAMQERAHRQLSGEETIPEILEALAPQMADAAREAGVSLIAETIAYHDAVAVEVVDVTETLTKRLAPAIKK